MTTAAWVLLVGVAVFAVTDWVAVVRGDRSLEYVAKPATTALLVALALAVTPDDPTQRSWFVAALLLSLAGDVFLMLPRDAFVPGLTSFLVAHLAYIVGLRREAGGFNSWGGFAIAYGISVGGRVLRAIAASGRRALLAPVVAYMVVITTMLVMALNTRDPRAIAGAVLFVLSDSLIAWNRFVYPVRHARFAIMSTYHLAQALLVLSLLPR